MTDNIHAEAGFDDLGLRDSVLKGVRDAGFDKPTVIQAELIPLMLEQKDVLGQAKTGTGKTASFALPLLHLCEKGVPVQALVVAPTRELAQQIREEFEKLGKHTPLRTVAIYGGQKIQIQADRLAKGPEIVVGTPGRILDLVNRGHLSLNGIKCVVLDEVDRMFDIGFRDDVRRILKHCPKERSTVVVSATFTEEIERLARQHMTNPEKIVTTSGSLTVSQVAQHYLTVRAWDKKRLLHHLLTHEDPALTIVFCRLKKTVDQLAKFLNEKGIEAHAMHGDMRQGKRNTVMKAFKSGKLAVLIASDLASRGIDVDGITHVINYDLPEDPDLYVHRIGRTARAGKDGVAWALVTPEQGKLLTQIELLIDAEIPQLDYEDFKHREEPPGSWKPDQPQTPTIDVKVKSRYDVDVPKKVNETKFPGGIVPSKLPPKRMHGRVSTGRTKKIEE